MGQQWNRTDHAEGDVFWSGKNGIDLLVGKCRLAIIRGLNFSVVLIMEMQSKMVQLGPGSQVLFL
jgi:hypothetical protein